MPGDKENWNDDVAMEFNLVLSFYSTDEDVKFNNIEIYIVSQVQPSLTP